MGLPFTPLATSLPATVPFVGPETQERQAGRAFAARLGANESPFGPSPSAIAAMAQAAADVWQYGDPENHDLREALAQHHGISPARISVGEGIDGLLQNAVRLFVQDGTPVVTSAGAYPTFNYHVNGFGGRLLTVPFRNDAEDPHALADAAAEAKAAIVYFANPDNPMGSWHPAEAVAELLARLPSETVLCLDEAYCDFAPADTSPSFDFDDPRLLRFRTFSKAYGMAGARIGYVVANADVAPAFNKVRNHFGVNRIAQAGALAALGDQQYLSAVLTQVDDAKNRIAAIARNNGLVPLPSATNFVTIDVGADGALARRLVTALAAEGVFVRMPFVAPQDRCIRVSAGPHELLDAFERALPNALAAAREEAPAAAQ